MQNVVMGALACWLVTTSFGGSLMSPAFAAANYTRTTTYYLNGRLYQRTVYYLTDSNGTARAFYGQPIQLSTPVIPLAPQPVSQPAPVVIKPVPVTATGNVAADEQKAVDLLNQDRAAQGLPALKVNSQLTSLAERYAQDMINRNYFSHYNPEGQSPFDRMTAAGIQYGYAGENIAIDYSVAGAESAFMNSQGHRDNILSANYNQVGIGIAYSSNGSLYEVQDFIGK